MENERTVHSTLIDAIIEHSALEAEFPTKRLGVFLVTRWDRPSHNKWAGKPGEVLGYQVVEIKRVGWWGRSPLGPDLAPKKAGEPAKTSVQATQTAQSVARTETVTVQFPFHQETNSYIGVLADGKVAWFGKTTLIDSLIENGSVRLTLPKKAIMKRGFDKFIAA